MSINTLYIPLDLTECYYVNKQTGEPLSSGIVKFYSDINRSTLKDIFQISGSPPNYTYEALPNPITLSSVGTFQNESNNDIIPYLYPYDESGNVENYFIEFYDSNEVLQFTREAVPNLATSGSSESNANDLINYIPNGQFLEHNNLPADSTYEVGEIRQAVTPIAPGGFYFERPDTSNSTDLVTFSEYRQYVQNPSASPRYAVVAQCVGSDSSDIYKYLSIRFGDVNKFSSDSIPYTFGFYAQSINTVTFDISLKITKYYGSGGSPSPTTTTTVQSITITPTLTLFSASFVFGSNENTQIGDNNDDYVAIVLSLPVDSSFGLLASNFILTNGDVVLTGFPQTTDSDFIIRSSTPPVRDPDGYNLFLPKVQTLTGEFYDDSSIGRIETIATPMSSSLSDTTNAMLLDGSQYLTSGYSSLGIPFARLQKKLWNDSRSIPIYGTGKDFVTLSNYSNNFFLLYGNSGGEAIPPVDGAISTGFTFFQVCNSTEVDYGYNVYSSNDNTIFFSLKSKGNIIHLSSSGTSGFTLSDVIKNDLRYVWTLKNSVTTTSLAGKYFVFYNLTDEYYLWFTVDGTGSDPSHAGTGIKVDLLSSFSQDAVLKCIECAITGVFCYGITIPNLPSEGSYFTFGTRNENKYLAYYLMDNVGNDPNINGYISIPIYCSASQTTTEIAYSTRYYIHSTYYAVPDGRGLIIRQTDPTQIWDYNADSRLGTSFDDYGEINSGNEYYLLGTLELDDILRHTHSINATPIGTQGGGTFDSLIYPDSTTLVNASGIYENRVSNIMFNRIIRY